MKKIFLSLILIIASLFVFAPNSVYANECDDLKAKFINEGGSAGQDITSQLPAYCTEGQVYNKIINLMYWFIGVIAVIAVIYGGYIYMTAGSNPAQASQGRKIIQYALAGVIVTAMAVILVQVVVNYVVDNKLF